MSNEDVKELQQERTSIFHDVYDNKIPKRVPVNLSMGIEALAQYGNVDIISAQWDISILEDTLNKLCQELYSDICPGGGSIRFPSYYDLLDSQSFMMGSDGFMQHPEVHGMLPEEYDDLIKNTYDTLIEKVIPRQYLALGAEDPFNVAITLAQSILAFSGEMGKSAALKGKMIEKYGYYPGAPAGSGGFTEAPLDFVADQLRGFKGMSMDLRRIPEKVAEACEAVYPIVLKRGMPTNVSNYGLVGMPLHMPTFMREKDFEKYYWPTFKKLVDEFASHGVHVSLFCEDDWTRYLDYLYELPTDTEMRFEYGDPKLIKEKLGKKHILTGLYPLTYLNTHTKQECVDKAKEYIDILAPGGKYFFTFDKAIVSANEINMENLFAVAEYVKNHAVYSNPGEIAGMQFHKEDYMASQSKEITSKYYKTWDDFKEMNPRISQKGRERLQGLEDQLFNHLTYLLI
ncbi:MAG: uroporphyrinogen decarboxylase family protein [Eubacteriaceae bacterium]